MSWNPPPFLAWDGSKGLKQQVLLDVHHDCREVTQFAEPAVNRISTDSDDSIAYGQAM
jgi:hypothetical protein